MASVKFPARRSSSKRRCCSSRIACLASRMRKSDEFTLHLRSLCRLHRSKGGMWLAIVQKHGRTLPLTRLPLPIYLPHQSPGDQSMPLLLILLMLTAGSLTSCSSSDWVHPNKPSSEFTTDYYRCQ